MVTTRKKPIFKPTPQPDWQSPRVPQPEEAITPPERKTNALDRAHAVTGLQAAPEIVAAVIISQAADRLCEALITAASIGRYRGT